MKSLLLVILTVTFVALPCRAADASDKHLLYLTSPDGAQAGGSGAGILIFDMDAGHRFVRRIDIPSFKEGLRGVCASAVTKRLYATTGRKRIICMDLLTDKVLWEQVYDTGCDRLNITPDGKSLYVPSAGGWMVVDAGDGNMLTRIHTPGGSHNTVVSLDGKRAFLAGNSWLSVVDTQSNTILHDIQTGSHANFPLTVNSDRTRAYVCLGEKIGFEIIDPEAGKILAAVYPDGDRIKRRTHGVGLSPDEKEIWIADQGGNAVYIFDNTQDPPKQTGKLTLAHAGHGWIGFSLDGKFAYMSSDEIFDAKEKKVIAALKDEQGKAVSSSKYVEIVFHGSDVVATGDQFGVGRLHVPQH